SNQIGNNGVLTGFIEEDGTTNFPFRPDPTSFLPDDPSIFLPSTFELATTDPDFKFPQIWRSNIAVDQQLPGGLVATVEFIYNKNVNAIQYINGNLESASGTFAGPDNRPYFPGVAPGQTPSGRLSGLTLNNAIRINDDIVNNIVLKNTDEGYSYSLTFQLEKTFSNGFFARLAYNFGKAKDLLSAGSIAAGSFTGIDAVRGNNNPDLAFSNNDQRHRIIGAFSYRKEYLKHAATEISLFYSAFNQGNYTYVYGGDLNGDGIQGNDLLYIPNDASELTFEEFTQSGQTFTVQQQVNAYNAFINSDPYLRDRRGQYAERNGALLPWRSTVDLTFIQEFFVDVKGKRNTLQFRMDILNFGNMINREWGVSQSTIQTSPVQAQGVTAEGVPVFRMATNVTSSGIRVPLTPGNVQYNASVNDVWQLQFGFRYIFN
ncbi:MAG: hypothetical protein HC880_10210, partial [Bacteroidia bacterium]|nr:hypothetical protein [Bacteroidia bacterium]